MRRTVEEHRAKTGSAVAAGVLEGFDPMRFRKVVTRLKPETIE